MSSALLNKAVVISLPFLRNHADAPNDFGVLKVDSDETHKQLELPHSWSGKLIAIRCFTNNVTVGLSPVTGAQINSDAAPSDAGTREMVGCTIVPGTLVACVLPTWGASKQVYLVHEADAADTVMELWAMELPNLD
jgi:hypothetical protein